MKEEIKNSYKKASLEYFGNSNSLHKLGLNSKKLEEAATNQILKVLKLKNYEIIYTSGNAESYTLILANLKQNESLITNSKEVFKIAEEMNKNLTFENPKKISHIDLSNNYELNKIKDLNSYDYITIEDEIPFFGVLIKKKTKELEPLIHGGKSTTKYRSGTAPTPLIVSFSKLIKQKYIN